MLSFSRSIVSKKQLDVYVDVSCTGNYLVSNQPYADETGPDMPTIRYGEADHPGPVSIRRRILRKFGDRVFRLSVFDVKDGYLTLEDNKVSYYLMIDEMNLVLDNDGCIPLLEKVGNSWDVCKEWKLQIRELTIDYDDYDYPYWYETYLYRVKVISTNSNSFFEDEIMDDYCEIVSLKFSSILIFWILKLKILAKRARRNVKKFRLDVFEQGVNQCVKRRNSVSNLKLLNHLGFWGLKSFKKELLSYLPIG